MLSLGGLMKNIIGAFTAAQALGILSKTDMVHNIIDRAASIAERLADFLEKFELNIRENKNDQSTSNCRTIED